MKLFRFIGVTSVTLIVSFNILQLEASCLDRPQLFLHQKSSVRELDSNETFVTLTDVNKEFLTCRSSHNVEWFYEGNGEPSKIQESSYIQIKSGEDEAADEEAFEYCMTSTISIYSRQTDTDLASHTGKYICQEVGNGSSAIGVHVFVGRRNAPAFLQSRRTITLPLGQENVTDSSSFLIPCGTSTPFVNATLFRKPAGSSNSNFKLVSTRSSETGVYNNVSEEIATFDPRHGFRVHIQKGQNLSDFHGDYKCVAKIVSSPLGKIPSENSGSDFVLYNVIQIPSFRVHPSEGIVYTSGILNFTCESTEEPVILKEVKIRSLYNNNEQYMYEDGEEAEEADDVNSNSVEDIEETVEKTEGKVHVANYLELNPAPGSSGVIECLSEKDKKVLHSWQYKVLGRKEEKLSGIKFNKREGSFSCRTKSGLPGRLSFVSCRTPSECRINGICLNKSENCRGYSNYTKALCHRGNNFCGKVFYKGGSGLIRCVGDGMGPEQIKGFTDEANDQILRMGFNRLKPSETAFLSLEDDEIVELKEGDAINVSLRLGHYYFLQPVQWALKLENGTTVHLTPEVVDLKKTKLHQTIRARLRLPLPVEPGWKSESGTFSAIVGLNALIPLRTAVPPSWKTITMPLTVVKAAKPSVPIPLTPEHQENTGEDGNEEIEGSGFGRSDLEFDEVAETTETQHIIDQVEIEQGDNIPTDADFGEIKKENVDEISLSAPTEYTPLISREDSEGTTVVY